MASRFALAPVPRWRHSEDYLALLDSLEAALPLARASRLSGETIARAIFALSEGLIGEIVGIVTRAATQAVRDGAEQITTASIEALAHNPSGGADVREVPAVAHGLKLPQPKTTRKIGLTMPPPTRLSEHRGVGNSCGDVRFSVA
jgi:hypothetical protein